MIALVAILVGAGAGLATLAYTRRFGRAEPRVWSQILVVMQAIYLVFALVAPDRAGMLREGLVLLALTTIAVAGSRFSTWFLPLGLLAHGAWDLRHLLSGEPYVVPFYPELCVGYDWLAFFFLLFRPSRWERAQLRPTAEEATA